MAAVFTQWIALAERLIMAVERVAASAERIADALERAEPAWRQQREIPSDKVEVLTSGR